MRKRKTSNLEVFAPPGAAPDVVPMPLPLEGLPGDERPLPARWEYCRDLIPDPVLVERLNRHGAGGWALVHLAESRAQERLPSGEVAWVKKWDCVLKRLLLGAADPSSGGEAP